MVYCTNWSVKKLIAGTHIYCNLQLPCLLMHMKGKAIIYLSCKLRLCKKTEYNYNTHIPTLGGIK